MRAGLPAAVTTTVFPILLRSWTTKSRLVPTPTGSGRDDPLRARRRRRSDPAERLLRRGRIRPRHRAADPHRRVAAQGGPTCARRAAHYLRPTALHRGDAARRDAHLAGHRRPGRGGAFASLRPSDFDGARRDLRLPDPHLPARRDRRARAERNRARALRRHGAVRVGAGAFLLHRHAAGRLVTRGRDGTRLEVARPEAAGRGRRRALRGGAAHARLAVDASTARSRSKSRRCSTRCSTSPTRRRRT